MTLTTSLDNAMLDYIFGGAAPFATTDAYLAIAVADITKADTGSTIVEPSYASYARLLLAGGDFSAAAASEKANAVELDFPEVDAGEPDFTVVAFAVVTAAAAGTIRIFGGITPATMSEAQIPHFTPGSLVANSL